MRRLLGRREPRELRHGRKPKRERDAADLHGLQRGPRRALVRAADGARHGRLRGL